MSPRTRFTPAVYPEFPNLDHEIEVWNKGTLLVAGIDEAGRGALAGPVSVGAVILPAEIWVMTELSGVRDSKQMSPKARASWKERVEAVSIDRAVGFATNLEIDELGIVQAVYLATKRALGKLRIAPQHLLVDFFTVPEVTIPQTALIKGDVRSLSIAAASILAKTERDAHMEKLDLKYPEYGFRSHKGYGTQAHREAVLSHGPCPIHRLSYHLPCVKEV